MARPVKGDVVVVPFPYSNLRETKRRPALVVTPLQGDDLILCQITSRATWDDYSVPLDETDFLEGKLRQMSNIRPNRIFTADQNLIIYRIGSLHRRKLGEVVERMVEILRT